MSAQRILLAAAIAILLSVNTSFSQSYDDVLVIINRNSSISDSIGTYFAQSRNIPSVNVARLPLPTAETIDSARFEILRSRIESYILNNNLQDAINYIVTTKGVPLRVNRGNTFSLNSPSSSVESELSLLLGSYSSLIGQAGSVSSPYYGANTHFSKAVYGFYLVSRLDGYNFNDVKAMIDRAAQANEIPTDAKFVLDQDPDWTIFMRALNENIAKANNLLVRRGFTTMLDTTTEYQTNQSNVMGYVSWGTNDHYDEQYTQHGKPNNTWVPGAIAETYVSTSGRSFRNPLTYGQSAIADLIAEGITGVKGYVYEPFNSAMANVEILFDRYTAGYNLAESYAMASAKNLSWMDVVIGDPKARLNPKRTVVNSIRASQGEQNNSAEVAWTTTMEYRNTAFAIERLDPPRGRQQSVWQQVAFVNGAGTTNEPQSYSNSDLRLRPGTYSYRVKSIDSLGNVLVSDTSTVTIGNRPSAALQENIDDVTALLPEKIQLANYPNPFNPTTEIRFTMPGDGKAQLKVFNTIGQEVATLVDGEISAGAQSVRFDASNLANGTYFYSLSVRTSSEQTNETVVTQKMMLLK